VLVFRLGVAGILLGNLLGYLIATGLCVYYARGNYKLIFEWAHLRELLRFSAPLVPSSLGYFVMFYVNRIALNFLLTLTDVGLYSIAYRLASPVNMIMNAVSSSLTPLIYNTYNSEKTPAELARIFRLLTAASLMLILVLSIFANEILHLMTTKEYYSAAVLIPFLALSAALSGMYIFTPGLFIAKDTGLVSVINVISGLLNIVLNYLMIPAFGVVGAALATCVALLFNLAVSIFFSQRRYFIPIHWNRILGGCIFSVAIVFVGLSLNTISLNAELVKLALLLAAAVLFLFVKLVETSEVALPFKYALSKLGSIGRNEM
jgi:O-antigen/teichoic acid export membrane protein